jgi:uncharacterized membrane protein
VLDDELAGTGAKAPPPFDPAIFRGREPPGTDLSRIIALSDGVFAFALTLLALSLAVPSLGSIGGLSNQQVSGRLAAALQGDYTAFYGYVFAFVMIAIWWVNHHRIFRYIERYDTTLIWLNLLLLMQIAVMPFVLNVFTTYGDTQTAVGLFSAVQASCGLTLGAIWYWASQGHRLTDPKLDPRIIHYFRVRGAITPVFFLISIGVTYVSVTGAELIWIGALVSQRLSGRYGTS